MYSWNLPLRRVHVRGYILKNNLNANSDLRSTKLKTSLAVSQYSSTRVTTPQKKDLRVGKNETLLEQHV